MTSSWTSVYPDLTGKTVIVAGDSPRIVEVARAMAANGALLAIVADRRAVVDDAVAVASALDAGVVGMTADPSSGTVWGRLAPHVEQRLGPIDVVVVLGEAALRAAVSRAVLPDMTARRRGVLVEVDETVAAAVTTVGVRHRGIQVGSGTADRDLAGAVLMCASDTITSSSMILTMKA